MNDCIQHVWETCIKIGLAQTVVGFTALLAHMDNARFPQNSEMMRKGRLWNRVRICNATGEFAVGREPLDNREPHRITKRI